MAYIKRTFAAILTVISIQIDAGSSLTSKVDFYGHQLNLTYDQQLSQLRFYAYDQREIAGKISYYRNSALKHAVYGVRKLAENYKLDDIALTLLIDKYAAEISKSTNSNQQVFIKYLMLKELEYDVLLTKTGTTLNCMGHLAFTPGRYISIQYNNKVYKDLDFKNRKNKGKHTIFGDSKQTSKRIGHNIKLAPFINARKRSKLLRFNFGVEKHEFTAESNQSIVEFLADIPMYKVGIEFTSLHMSKEMDTTVIAYLTGQIADREIVDQVRFLLAFVQQVVPYGSDYDKYGEERFYYPEETIMASTADCEDKAMLLAYLTKEILGLNSVGLYFQKDEHLSLGIEIPGYEPTGSFGYNGKQYVSCEPTANYPRLTQSQFSLDRVNKVIEL
jgi:hypothetical protein